MRNGVAWLVLLGASACQLILPLEETNTVDLTANAGSGPLSSTGGVPSGMTMSGGQPSGGVGGSGGSAPAGGSSASGGSGGSSVGGAAAGSGGATAECVLATDCLDGKVCSPAKTCLACKTDPECATAYPLTPLCASGTCVGCKSGTDCSGVTPVCDASGKSCRGCQLSSECGSGGCDTVTGQCVAELQTVYALAETGLDAPCGTQVAPCRNLATAAGFLTDTRPNLVLIATNQSFNVGATLPPILGLKVIGNGVLVHPYTDTPAFDVKGGSVQFDGMNVTNGVAATAAALTCTNASITVVRSTVSDSASGIKGNDCDVFVSDSKILRNGSGISAQSSAPASTPHVFTLERSRLEGNVYALSTNGAPVVIRNNLFLRNGNENYTRVISFYSEVGTPYFGFNTLVGNFNNCIYIGIVACNGSATPAMDSNISWGNFPSRQPGACENQVFYGCSSMSNNITETVYPGVANLSLDPMFTAPASDDYSLKVGSPAIDKASTTNTPATDYLGNARPKGLAPDIGAHESY